MRRCPKCGADGLKTRFEDGVVRKECRDCSAEFEALQERGQVLHIWMERIPTTNTGGT
jgi:Zn ribbon nucleic-acid-binding protein